MGSPVHGVPKKNGKIRPVHNLSKEGDDGTPGVNQQLDPELTTCSYPKFLEVVALLAALPEGAFLWLVDLKSAYRQIRLAVHNAAALGLKFEHFYYFDCSLP